MKLKNYFYYIVFHLEISGKEVKHLQMLNIYLIFITLTIFHLEISGNGKDDLYHLSIVPIVVTLEVYHYEISTE